MSNTTWREVLTVSAFRRNSDASAEQLRNEIPILLGRLAAEVPGSVFELNISTTDGVVNTELVIAAGATTGELCRDASAILAPVAELKDVDGHSTDDWAVWPLVSAGRSAVGFRAGESAPVAPTQWIGSQPPELVKFISVHAGSGVRIRLRVDGAEVGTAEQWRVDAAVLTISAAPTFRLRAHVRSEFPGLRVAGDRDAAPAVLRLRADRLASLFAVPVGGEEPMPGTFVAGAAPVPVHPVRQTICPSASVRLGYGSTVAGQQLPIFMGDQERLRHVHVLGRTGTGKSSFLAGFTHEVARKGDGLLVLDPHGHLVDRIIAELPDAAADRTWVIRCGDVDNPVPLNPLAVDDRVRREIAIDDVCGVFQYLFDKKNTGIVGPRFRERVAMGLRALAAVFGPRASLLDVPAALADPRFIAKASKVAADDRLKAWLANDMANRKSGEYADLVSWVNSKFEAFSSTTAMRGILGSGADAIDMAAAMDAGRIVLVDLSKSMLGESATSLLGYLYINRVWTSALQRGSHERPFTVIVDEAQAMSSGSLTAMLTEGRKFGLSVVLAHQYLGQLDDDLRPAVDGNVATTVAFRGAAGDVPALRQRFGDSVESATLMTLPDLSAVILRTAAGIVAQPHTLVVDHNQKVRARTGERRKHFDDALTAATVRDLVDAFRDDTAPAAAGRSSVVSAAVENVKAPAPRPGGATPQTNERQKGFLDDWLARRAQAMQPAGGSPSVTPANGRRGEPKSA